MTTQLPAQPAQQRLTSIDASFLYFEKPYAPMHVGSVEIFEGEIPYEDFVRNIEAKLPLLPRYVQRVNMVPFNLGHPTWERDLNFNIRNHIMFRQLEAPGSEHELRQMARQCLSGMLDRNKPLWEIFVVHGLADGNTALISRVHHAMIDGISGVDLTKIMLDVSPEASMKLPEIPAGLASTAMPVTQSNPTKSVIDGIIESTEAGLKSWADLQIGLLNITEGLARDPFMWMRSPLTGFLPSMTTPAPILPLNKTWSGQRDLTWSAFSFGEARAIRAAVGGTVNDVVLTVLSGAIIRYVEMHGQKTTDRKLRVMVPVSLRKEEQRGALGNLVTALPIEIPLGIKDPLERMAYIIKTTGEVKEARLAESFNLLTAMMSTVPPAVQAFFGTLANTPVPIYNTVCTNVPGPQIPLYALGHRLLTWYPYVPVGYGIGIGCAIMSYDQKLFFGLTSDAEAISDADLLKQYLDESFVELRQAAGVAPKAQKVS